MLHAGFTGSALLLPVQREHDVVCSVVKRDELKMGLQTKQRVAIERGDLIKRERRALGVVEGLDKSPLDADYIERQPMAAARVFRMRREPCGQAAAQIAQRERAAWVVDEICNG